MEARPRPSAPVSPRSRELSAPASPRREGGPTPPPLSPRSAGGGARSGRAAAPALLLLGAVIVFYFISVLSPSARQLTAEARMRIKLMVADSPRGDAPLLADPQLLPLSSSFSSSSSRNAIEEDGDAREEEGEGGAAADPPFILADALVDYDFSGHRRAGGCPPLAAGSPSHALCRLEDVFDEIIVLSLPRRTRELARIRSQLRALGTPYTLVRAFDKRSGAMKPLAESYLSSQKAAGVLALFVTQLAVFEYIARSPYEHVLILEDDVVLHRDFPAQFDARARRIPSTWRSLFLGANVRNFQGVYPNSTWAAGGWHPATFDAVGFYRPLNIWGSWAVGVHRDFARVLADTMALSRAPIDHRAYEAGFAAWPDASYVMWPAVAMTDARSSELSHAVDAASVAARFVRNGWDPAGFDAERGYFVPGQEGEGGARVEPEKPAPPGQPPPQAVASLVPLRHRPAPSFAPGVALGVLAYDPVIAANNNVGDWYQSAAALFGWWSALRGAQDAGARHGRSRVRRGEEPRSFRSFVMHAVGTPDKAPKLGQPPGLLRRLGAGAAAAPAWPPVVWLERDTIPLEKRPPGVTHVVAVMNGWWMQRRIPTGPQGTGGKRFGYPFPPWVVPIFISFHVSDASLLQQTGVAAYLREHAPIGARDEATRDALMAVGVDAYFSGCITPLLRLQDDGCAGFDRGGAPINSCAVDMGWGPHAAATFKQNPSGGIMTREPSWLVNALQKYCTSFRWCRRMDTTRLHVWFPLRMNGYDATLHNKRTQSAVRVRPGDNRRAGYMHPGVAIDGRRTNRFGGLLEAAAAGDPQPYIDRVYRDLLDRIVAAVAKANGLAAAEAAAAAAAGRK